jgi:hypothetical protein
MSEDHVPQGARLSAADMGNVTDQHQWQRLRPARLLKLSKLDLKELQSSSRIVSYFTHGTVTIGSQKTAIAEPITISLPDSSRHYPEDVTALGNQEP